MNMQLIRVPLVKFVIGNFKISKYAILNFIFQQAAQRAKELRAKFEEWEQTQDAKDQIHQVKLFNIIMMMKPFSLDIYG